MTAAVIAASISIILAAAPLAYLWAAARWPNAIPLPTWIERLPAPPALADLLTIPFRLRSAGGEHTARAVAERTLIFDELRGQYRHAETGPMTLPQQYLDYAGKAAEGWWGT